MGKSNSKPQTQTELHKCVRMHPGTTMSRSEKSRGSIRKRCGILNTSLSLQSTILRFVKLHPEALGTPSSRHSCVALMDRLQLNEWLRTWSKQSDGQTNAPATSAQAKPHGRKLGEKREPSTICLSSTSSLTCWF